MKKLFFIAILGCNFLNAQSNLFPATGNVGIGTTAPAEKLEVNEGNIFLNSAQGQFVKWNNTGFAPPSFINRSAGTKLVLWPSMGAETTDVAIGIDGGTVWQAVPQNDAFFSHKFYGGTTPLMTIRGDGNVGIGTTSPTATLDVAGSTRIQSLVGSTTRMVVADNSGLLATYPIPSGGNDNLGNHTATTILNMGNNPIFNASALGIGIGNNSPAVALDVNGDALITGLVGIGIGNTVPAATLDVNGGAQIRGLAGVSDRMVVANATGALSTQPIPSGSSDNLGNHTATTTLNMNSNSIAGTSTIGIGTTAPTEKLEVNSGNIFLNSAQGQFVKWNNTGFAPPSFINRSAGTKLVLWPSMGAETTDVAIGIDGGTVWQAVPQNDAFFSHKFYGGTTPLMTIRGDGNVGIGTVNPLAKLAVAGTALISSLAGEGNRAVVADANGLLTTQAIPPGNNDNLGNHTATTILNMGNNPIYNTSAVGIGIGNTAPAATLDVNGSVQIRSLEGQADRMVIANAAGALSTQPIPSGGSDNLGNHIAIRTLNMGNNNISNISNVAIGTIDTAEEKLQINNGNIFLNSAAGQFIRWTNNGYARPSFNTRSIGTKLVLFPGITSISTDYAIGIEQSGALWHSVPTNSGLYSHKFYGGTTELMTIRGDGNVGIGTISPAYKLDVIGTVRAREVRVNLDGADFVFEDGYKLMPLNEVEKFVKQNKHLPEIAPAKEMQEKGSDLGGLTVQLLQKIEELTLHAIEQNKKIEILEAKMNNK